MAVCVNAVSRRVDNQLRRFSALLGLHPFSLPGSARSKEDSRAYVRTFRFAGWLAVLPQALNGRQSLRSASIRARSPNVWRKSTYCGSNVTSAWERSVPRHAFTHIGVGECPQTAARLPGWGTRLLKTPNRLCEASSADAFIKFFAPLSFKKVADRSP